jgi:hypothetical protein
MKRNLIILISFVISSCSYSFGGAELKSLPRAPYKEVRTKRNQDPAVREALRQKMEREHNEREQHRKMVEAKMKGERLAGKTNKASLKASEPPPQKPAADSKPEKAADPSPKTPEKGK